MDLYTLFHVALAFLALLVPIACAYVIVQRSAGRYQGRARRGDIRAEPDTQLPASRRQQP